MEMPEESRKIDISIEAFKGVKMLRASKQTNSLSASSGTRLHNYSEIKPKVKFFV